MDRPLPQNIEAERGLLGIVMERNDALFSVSHIVTKTDFIEPFHGEVFTLMRDMIESGREAAPSTLIHDLNQDADIGGISASAYLHLLVREAPNDSMAVTFARTIRDLAMRRRLIAVAQKHVDEAYSAPATISAAEIESRYHAAASELFTTVQEAGLQPLQDLSKGVIQDVQAAYKGERRLGLTSGLKAWDDLCGPLLGKRTYMLSGASGSGKTALAWQIATNVAITEPVLFESIEMAGDELATRDLSALTGIESARIDRGDLNEEDIIALIEARKRQSENLVVDNPRSPTVGSIRGKAMRMKRLRGLGLIVIDHLRYIRSPVRGDLFEQQSEILQGINAMADDLDVPVILLCQLKASYGAELGDWRKIRPPHVGDIFNGAVIEQEADALILVHREEYMLARRKPAESSQLVDWEEAMKKSKDRAKLLLQKRRGGVGTGERTTGFYGHNQQFTDELPRIDFFAPLLR